MVPSPLDQADAPPETREPKLSARHIKALDGVRGLAVLAVILYHVDYMLSGSSLPVKVLHGLLDFGWSGVDLFFVLSGFLITGILLDTRDSPNYFRAFYARRSLRIFPLYYLVLSAVLLVSHFTSAIDYALPISRDRIFYFFYLNNWWPLLRDTWHTNIIGHFWSLAVEEQFYLLWSLCVFFAGPRRVKRTAAIGIVGALLLRCAIVAHSGVTRNVIENTFCRMDPLLVGALLAAIVRDRNFLRRSRMVIYGCGVSAALGALILFYLVGRDDLMNTVGLSLLALAFGGLVFAAFEQEGSSAFPFPLLASKRLRTVGKYSYGMYVYHVPVMHTLRATVHRWYRFEQHSSTVLLFMVLVLGVTFVIAMASFELFEKRFLDLKKYFRAS